VTADDLCVLVLARLAQLLDVDRALLDETMPLASLGLDSTVVMEVVYEVEDRTGVVLTERDLAAIDTVADLVACVGARSTEGVR
jgi:acyl carrier protein